MIPVTVQVPQIPPELDLYCTRDPLLEGLPVLLFYGASTTANSTSNGSRIQAHVLSIAGYQHFPRITISPTSPLYVAVNHLPSDLQGDEVCRGLAVSLLSYFASISRNGKSSLQDLARSRRANGAAPAMFDEMHAAGLAASMELIEDRSRIISYLRDVLSTQFISWLDVDLILPDGSINRATTFQDQNGERTQLFDENGCPVFRYGIFDDLLAKVGTPAFLPTSKLKRAPSRPPLHAKARQLSKDAKIALRREMCELVDTESNYMAKVNELVNEIGASCQRVQRSKELSRLFPDCLSEILSLSKDFFNKTQGILDKTEDDAIRDIESGESNEQAFAHNLGDVEREDPTGATLIAQAFLEWFPRFYKPYETYLRLSCDFGDLLTHLLNDMLSPASKILRDIGEQRLRSLLIEPVQRLPRYNLIIDNIIQLLPHAHPSFSGFLKARDIVKDICALDSSGNGQSSSASRLLDSLVQNWSLHFKPSGRLLTAIDVTELASPSAISQPAKSGILLLFSDGIVALNKPGDFPLTARGILAEIDRPTVSTQVQSPFTGRSEKSLQVSASLELSQTQVTESEDGRIVHLAQIAKTPNSQTLEPRNTDGIMMKSFYLLGQYEGRSTRLGQEIIMARIEGRYSEMVRDSGKWALRTIADQGSLNVVVALSEHQSFSNRASVGSPAPVRILLKDLSTSQESLAIDENNGTLNILVALTGTDQLQLRVTVDGEVIAKMECSSMDIPVVLNRQLELGHQYQRRELAVYNIPYLMHVLASVPSTSKSNDGNQRPHRPISPVKMLSKMLGGQSSQQSTPARVRHESAYIKDLPPLPRPDQISRQTSPQGNHQTESPDRKLTVLNSDEGVYKSPLALLEDTFIAYLISLRSRSGNVVGKTLRNRAAADELAVNEVYNSLLEDPSRIETGAPIDTIFVAFEKFLRRAWRERMGPLVSPAALQRMQSIMDKSDGSTFAEHFKTILNEMSPQNRRGFIATIQLLSDLLDASGSDADRGILIMSFSEALVLVGNPHDYITLLDRLVEDFETLFDEAIERGGSSGSASSSVSQSRSYDKGSHNSKTSSFRKRFGFGSALSRENMKLDSESKVSTLLRTWSKGGKGSNEGKPLPGNISKTSLVRSKSTDTDARALQRSFLTNQSKQANTESIPWNEPQSRPGSSYRVNGDLVPPRDESLRGLPTVPKKKRRSSLSDLKILQDNGSALDLQSPLQAHTLTPSYHKPTSSSARGEIVDSSTRNENSPPKQSSPTKVAASRHPPNQSPRKSRTPSGDIIVQSALGSRRQTAKPSPAAAPKEGLIERTWPPNGNTGPLKQTTNEAPRKPRIQNPQKIRERLNQEQSACLASSAILQAEIDSIGQELSTSKLRSRAAAPSVGPDASILSDLSTRLDSLAKSIHSSTSQHAASVSALRKDFDATLGPLEKRARQLEELYSEANAENEVLYERFNDELSKVLGRIKRGEGVEEMRSRLGQALEEAGSLRSERARLRREIVELRSRLPG